MPHSSSGLGHRPLKAETGVRVSNGASKFLSTEFQCFFVLDIYREKSF
jgi:hypothetical protein